ncbi:phage portal protein [Vibrio vulnificus]|uniref:phage portal protein n=1 Tax=Vibrio vulnificus TaxID=672 RepID=UPI000CD02343|nr:phage portal protein [Vibrio vulnificus]POC58490.1 phage portal protein [Vibrio vulnificus]POC73060.1 phage portal protein [Vibrio vulnificus]
MSKSNKLIQRMIVSESRRMFEAASPDRMTLSWDSNSYTADQVLYSQLPVLRARARQQSRNNDYVVRLIQLLQNNIVGAAGFKARSQVVDFEGNADRPARKAIETGWAAFAHEVDLTELEHLVMAAMVTDGEAFVFIHEGKNGVKPEIVDPVRVDVEYNRSEQGKNVIVMGIEYNGAMEPEAYWVNDSYDKHHPGVGENAGATVERTRVPASKMLHIFRKMYVGQKRGFPWISASLGRLFQLGRFEEAALMAARIGAAKMGFFRSEQDDEYTGDGQSGDMNINAEAGTFENIGAMHFEAFDPTYPSGEFKVFVEKILKGVSSGWGMDYHTVGNDLSGVNYSSARVGMLETREYYKTLQGWLIHKLIQPIFKRWLAVELFSQRITINNRPLSRGLFYYSPVQFVGRRWDWVDPVKEAQSKRIQYDMKVISLSQIIRERGDDPEDVFSEIAEENKLMLELGITPAQVLQVLEVESDKNDKE